MVYFFSDFSSEDEFEIDQSVLLAFQQEVDSLQSIENQKRKPQIYPFNPNYISDYKGYQLGLSVAEIDRLHAFRARGKFVNSVEQFKQVTKVSDSLLNTISPYFKFPEWLSTKKKEIKAKSKKLKPIPAEKKDINLSDVADFKEVYGIGDKLAARIVNYRKKLQGFSEESQLYEVWYLDKDVADRVLNYFEIKTPPSIQKLNINEATFKEVLSIAYINYELTKKIFRYRDEVAEIQSIEELKKIDGFPLDKFTRIALYLVAE